MHKKQIGIYKGQENRYIHRTEKQVYTQDGEIGIYTGQENRYIYTGQEKLSSVTENVTQIQYNLVGGW